MVIAYHPEAFRCDTMRSGVSELLDGELDGHARARLGLHLAACPPCARFAVELAAVVHGLHRLRRAARRVRARC